MSCSRQTNNMIKTLHKRALRLAFNDHVSDFGALICKSNYESCHHRNIQIFFIKLYKIKNELAPPSYLTPKLWTVLPEEKATDM